MKYQPVFSVESGTVDFVGYEDGRLDQSGGLQISIRHDAHGMKPLGSPGQQGEVFSLYAHLSTVLVTAGESVMRGQRIATSGFTGGLDSSTAPSHAHLHLEGRWTPDGTSVFDPYGWGSYAPWQPPPGQVDPWMIISGNPSVRFLEPGVLLGGPPPATCPKSTSTEPGTQWSVTNKACPLACGPEIILDDADPNFLCIGCSGTDDTGFRGQHHKLWSPPGGSSNLASWTTTIPQGTYQVEAFIPQYMGPIRELSAAVEYRVDGGNFAVVSHQDLADQSHRRYNDKDGWLDIGVFFVTDNPVIEVLAKRGLDYSGSATPVILVDAIRLTPICNSGYKGSVGGGGSGQ